MLCSKCGFNNSEEASTCANCGTSLAQESLANTEANAAQTPDNSTSLGTTTTQTPTLENPAQPSINPTHPSTETDFSAVNTASSVANAGYNETNATNIPPAQQPTMMQNSNTAPAFNPPSPKKGKRGLLIAIAAAAAVAVAAIVTVVVILAQDGNSPEANGDVPLEEALTSSKSFFLANENGLSAIFDMDGKRLTDFIFRISSLDNEFFNGVLRIQNEAEEYGVVDQNGKMIIDFGACRYLRQYGSIYHCTDSDFNESLIDSKGKELAQAKNIDIVEGNTKYVIAQIKDRDKDNSTFIVYNYAGKVLGEFSGENDKIYSEDDFRNDYVTVYYNGVNHIYNVATGKEALSFADKMAYCVSDVNPTNDKEYVIKSDCISLPDAPNEEIYKLVRNDKIAYEKQSTDYMVKLNFQGNNVLFDASLLDETGETILNVKSAAYKDGYNYAKDNEKVDVYSNGELKNQTNCYALVGYGYTPSGVYALRNCHGYTENEGKYDSKYIFVTSDGEILGNKAYGRIYAFNENDYAIVSDEDTDPYHPENNRYYLINTKGERVSDDYVEFASDSKEYDWRSKSEFYIGVNTDGTESIFLPGESVIKTAEKTYSMPTNSGTFIIAENGNTATVYSMQKHADVATVTGDDFKTTDYYFSVNNDGKTQYYSYLTGKIFHER